MQWHGEVVGACMEPMDAVEKRVGAGQNGGGRGVLSSFDTTSTVPLVRFDVQGELDRGDNNTLHPGDMHTCALPNCDSRVASGLPSRAV